MLRKPQFVDKETGEPLRTGTRCRRRQLLSIYGSVFSGRLTDFVCMHESECVRVQACASASRFVSQSVSQSVSGLVCQQVDESGRKSVSRLVSD